MKLARRELFVGLAGVLAMPAIVHAQSLMRVVPPKMMQTSFLILVRRNDDGTFHIEPPVRRYLSVDNDQLPG